MNKKLQKEIRVRKKTEILLSEEIQVRKAAEEQIQQKNADFEY